MYSGLPGMIKFAHVLITQKLKVESEGGFVLRDKIMFCSYLVIASKGRNVQNENYNSIWPSVQCIKFNVFKTIE